MNWGSENISHFHRESTVSPPQTPNKEGRISSLLDVFLERQKESFISWGFHRQLDQTDEEYRRGFPELVALPETYRGSVLTAVDPRISLKTLHELAEIYEYGIEAINIVNRINAPIDKPYIIYLRNRATTFNSIGGAMAGLKGDEGSTWRELIAFYLLHYRKHLEPTAVFRAFSATGSRVRTEHGELIPTLDLYAGKPVARGTPIDSLYPNRILSRMNIINAAA